MNKFAGFLVFLTLVSTIPAQGQFNTVNKQRTLYQIEKVSTTNSTNNPLAIQDKSVSPTLIPNAEIPNITGKDSLQKRYIEDYMSVSFPMKQLVITSPFGWRADPFTGKQRKHNGLDLRASDDEVYAMMKGKVKKTGEDRRSGKYVILAHGNFQITYCHLSRIWVEKGQEVKSGEGIGITGNTGRSTGPHLHITCKKDNKYVNPIVLIQYIKEIRENALRLLCNNP